MCMDIRHHQWLATPLFVAVYWRSIKRPMRQRVALVGVALLFCGAAVVAAEESDEFEDQGPPNPQDVASTAVEKNGDGSQLNDRVRVLFCTS